MREILQEGDLYVNGTSGDHDGMNHRLPDLGLESVWWTVWLFDYMDPCLLKKEPLLIFLFTGVDNQEAQ